MFILTTFYTESYPHDTAENLIEAEKKFKKSANDYCDNYISYCPRKIINENPEFEEFCRDYTVWLNGHNNKSELGNYNRTWSRLGFQIWKPNFLKFILEKKEINYGDILMYHDVNVEKYPQYLLGCEEWRFLSEAILDDLKCDIFVPIGLPLKYDTKDFLTQKYNVNNEKIGLWNGIVILRKSAESLFFLKEWAEMCSLENISPLPNPKPNKETYWHSVDQSVMGVFSHVWKEKKLLPDNWPKYHLENRILSNSNLRVLL